MVTDATFTLPAASFPLGTVFDTFPAAGVEMERVVPAVDVVIPYVWVRGVDTDDIKAAFSAHPGVRDIQLVDSVLDEYLLRVEWEPDYVGILTTLTETGVTVMRAVGDSEKWTFDVRGDTQEAVAAFLQQCRERDLPVALTALHATRPLKLATEAALTDAQREVLTLAYQRGFFESPRRTTMEALGTELGISQQAVSARLQRGTRSLVEQAFPALTATSSDA